jgi:transcriptional regulator with XRE-family HTH domain
MSSPVNPEQLRRELASRGMEANDLAKQAHLSGATLSSALAGRAISAASLRRIAAALQATPVDEVIERLLGPVGTTSEDPNLAPQRTDTRDGHHR